MSSKTVKSTGEKIFDGIAKFSVIKNKIIFYISIIIGIILVGIGIKLFFTDDSHIKTYSGVVNKILSVKEKKIRDRYSNIIQYEYNLEAKINMDDLEVIKNVKYTTNTKLYELDDIKISYNTKTGEATQEQLRNKTGAYILSGLTLCILLGTGLYYYLSRESKIFATVDGASSLVNTIV
jgi:hypothetical protein